jgi:hypothetical protein
MVAGMSRDEFVAHSAQKAQTIGRAETVSWEDPRVHSGQHCANVVARDAVASKHWTPVSPLAVRATVLAPRFPHNHEVSEAWS